MEYLHEPKAIYNKSFATIEAEADLSRFTHTERPLATRLIHASGMLDIVDDLVMSPDAILRGQTALTKGASIICDVNMVVHGIISRMLPANNPLMCGLDLPEASAFAQKNKHTRSAGGIMALEHKIDGAVIVIGNAPTALFYLLDMLGRTKLHPAIVLGFPVGFVGAAESKHALIHNNFNLPFIALRGRRGGSALAAAALNALASGLRT